MKTTAAGGGASVSGSDRIIRSALGDLLPPVLGAQAMEGLRAAAAAIVAQQGGEEALVLEQAVGERQARRGNDRPGGAQGGRGRAATRCANYSGTASCRARVRGAGCFRRASVRRGGPGRLRSGGPSARSSDESATWPSRKTTPHMASRMTGRRTGTGLFANCRSTKLQPGNHYFAHITRRTTKNDVCVAARVQGGRCRLRRRQARRRRAGHGQSPPDRASERSRRRPAAPRYRWSFPGRLWSGSLRGSGRHGNPPGPRPPGQ